MPSAQTSAAPETLPEVLDETPEAGLYELCVLSPVNLSQKEEQTLLSGIEELFAEAEGKLVAKDAWGRRGLAYRIKKQTEGNFVIYYFEVNPQKLKEVDKQLRILPNVLRHLIVKPPKEMLPLIAKGTPVKYSERYEQWIKDQATAVETERREEEGRLQKKVADRAKIQAKRTEVKKKEVQKKVPTSTLEEADLSKKLEELISDDTLGL